MKKIILVEDLDCANCAAKLERALAKLDGVSSVTVSFLTQKITLEAEEADLAALLPQIVKTAKKTVPECTLLL